jgi:hypothetical protein
MCLERTTGFKKKIKIWRTIKLLLIRKVYLICSVRKLKICTVVAPRGLSAQLLRVIVVDFMAKPAALGQKSKGAHGGNMKHKWSEQTRLGQNYSCCKVLACILIIIRDTKYEVRIWKTMDFVICRQGSIQDQTVIFTTEGRQQLAALLASDMLIITCWYARLPSSQKSMLGSCTLACCNLRGGSPA